MSGRVRSYNPDKDNIFVDKTWHRSILSEKQRHLGSVNTARMSYRAHANKMRNCKAFRVRWQFPDSPKSALELQNGQKIHVGPQDGLQTDKKGTCITISNSFYLEHQNDTQHAPQRRTKRRPKRPRRRPSK